MTPSLLIEFAGIDGVGKTTLMEATATDCRDRGLAVTTWHFPFDDGEFPYHALKRHFAGEETLEPEVLHAMFWANRRNVWESRMRPLYDSGGEVLLSDSWLLRALAYGRTDMPSHLWAIADAALQGLPSADVVLLLDSDASIAMSRLTERDPCYESNGAFQSRCRELHRGIAPNYTTHTIDASQPPEAVLAQALEILEPHVARLEEA